jgi:hypothetical protein
MTDTKPTPRPWAYIKNRLGTVTIGNPETYQTIAVVASVEATNNEVNAAHIVHCVNNFDALLEAAKDLLCLIANECPQWEFAEIANARAAIAQAEGTG